MTIQRQFILPNCTLVLEGISNSMSDAALGESLDVLLRLECQFGDLTQPLTGGLDLLNSLIQATNQCTQSWMSGVPHRRPARLPQEQVAVHLLHTQDDDFELSVPIALLNESSESAEDPLRIHLTTLQLFDLVEALDQLLADQQTLPNLSLAVRPLSRSASASGQSLQRSTPALLGAVSVAIAAAAVYFIPIPKASPPPKNQPTPASTSAPAVPGTSAPVIPGTPTPSSTPVPINPTSEGATPVPASPVPDSPAPNSSTPAPSPAPPASP